MKCEKYESDPPLWKAIRWEIKFISKNVGFLFISLFHLITYHQNKCIKFSGRFFLFSFALVYIAMERLKLKNEEKFGENGKSFIVHIFLRKFSLRPLRNE